jgi:uncharacterized protein YecT (DUF1311 family)
MKKMILLMLFSSHVLAIENCTSENTNALEQCSYNNYKSEDQLLNYLYEDIVVTFPKIKDEVKKIQQLWIKVRDEVCTYTPDDGEEYKINQNTCLYQQTVERNRELRAILTKEANSGSLSATASKPKWDEYIKNHCDFMERNFSDSKCKVRNNFLHSDQ